MSLAVLSDSRGHGHVCLSNVVSAIMPLFTELHWR